MAKKKNITKKQNLKKKLGQTSASKKTEVSEPISSGTEKTEDVLFAIEPIEDDLARVAAAVTELEDIYSAKVPDVEIISTQANALSKIDELPKYGGSPLTGEELKQQLAKIVEWWHSMNGIDDLCVVLNMALQALHGMDAVKTTVGRLKLMARKGRYVTFKIPKKKKEEFRTIDAPCSELKNIQQALNFVLQEVYNPNTAAMGFVKGKSVVTNAQVHLGQNYVYNIDLKDFFPSIASGRVFKRLLVKPFCLDEKVASLISDLCCYQKGDNKVLPQGAPTSPTITNIICENTTDAIKYRDN